ncbi:hypothetical protein MCHI_001699 [Candidatus Magnetoovum chiemensis]|nr:hypothetical protein MCHI_001699 [Candidatus Magnetoovum chiemensis]
MPDLTFWLDKAYNPGNEESMSKLTPELDCEDYTRDDLVTEGVANLYADCRNTEMNEKSFWNSSKPLWAYIEASDVDLTAYKGQILLVQESGTGWESRITIIAVSLSGEVVYKEKVKY